MYVHACVGVCVHAYMHAYVHAYKCVHVLQALILRESAGLLQGSRSSVFRAPKSKV